MSSALLVLSVSGARRRDRALEWLALRGRSSEVLVVGATFDAASDLARAASKQASGSFGWSRATLGRLAASIASPALAARGLSPAGALPLEAICARVVDALRRSGTLGRFQAVADFPGLPRAIARTLTELRLAGLAPHAVEDPDLARVHRAYEEQLARDKLADRAEVLRIATEVLVDPKRAATFERRAVLFLDVPVGADLERDLLAAVGGRAPHLLATVPIGDDRSLDHHRRALPEAVEMVLDRDEHATTSLGRLQTQLFSGGSSEESKLDPGVVMLSAPGESRESVEIARIIHREAARGVRFDRMAILLRSPDQYRAHIQEALRRARIPAFFAKGTVLPDPAGRAFVALLACAAENLSARRFAEYLSLGQLPDTTEDGAPPPAKPFDERWVPPDEELIVDRLAEPVIDLDDEEAPLSGRPEPAGRAGTLKAPRRWERLLVESAVIGDRSRWVTRLDGLALEIGLAMEEREREGQSLDHMQQKLEDLRSLRAFALPLLDDLEALAIDEQRRPRAAPWGEWIDRLGALATRALRDPERVLSVLHELSPMADVGPVELPEVRLLLGKRLTELVAPDAARRRGRVYIAAALASRGLAFDVVFVPGLAEKLFPQKVVEDAILRDAGREHVGLATQADRVATERLALRLAVGAARERVVLSYPRVDLDQSRPRVPSFYGLEVLRAAEGKLPGFDELAQRAERGGAARIGFPAPDRPEDAIDDAEYDLALLEGFLRLPQADSTGAAHYLLAHPHLARALRFRGRRWNVKEWKGADGLVDDAKDPMPAEARAALAKHGASSRSFSATALQKFASCPYRFVLESIMKLSPREAPEAIEEIDPLSRGHLVHEVLFEAFKILAARGLLPFNESKLDEVRSILDDVLLTTAREYKEKLAPAIDRVWQDGVDAIRADVREMLRRMAGEAHWVPVRFELSFGLESQRDRDVKSQKEPVILANAVRLRGSIDLVERHTSGAIRATDYKTGKQRAKEPVVIAGGEILQPVLYALALEKLFPDARVDAGRLYYATSAGGFENVIIPLDDDARAAAMTVATTVFDAVDRAFLPAAPNEGACATCEYQVVCGPYEWERSSRKKTDALVQLKHLREMR